MKKWLYFTDKKKWLQGFFILLLCFSLLTLAGSGYKAHKLEYLYEATPEELARCLTDKGLLSSWGWYSEDEIVSHQWDSTGISELGTVTLEETQALRIEVKTRFGAAKIAILSPQGDLALLESPAGPYVAQSTGEYRVYSVMKHFWGAIQVTQSDLT